MLITPADFGRLKCHRVIVVTGPQRSGTRIATHMIAHSLFFQAVEERAFEAHDEAAWWEYVSGAEFAVVHSPGMCHVVHEVPDDVGVVLMRRPLRDIYASEARIQWEAGAEELRKYKRTHGVTACRPAALKYELWPMQAKRIAHAYELRYDSLYTHPLWVPKAKRSGFRWNQWR